MITSMLGGGGGGGGHRSPPHAHTQARFTINMPAPPTTKEAGNGGEGDEAEGAGRWCRR